ILAANNTLARFPLSGGAPRQVLDNVIAADWSPDGSSMAVATSVGLVRRIQFPIGRTLLETRSQVFSVRVSPGGNLVAVSSMSSPEFRVSVVDGPGKE